MEELLDMCNLREAERLAILKIIHSLDSKYKQSIVSELENTLIFKPKRLYKNDVLEALVLVIMDFVEFISNRVVLRDAIGLSDYEKKQLAKMHSITLVINVKNPEIKAFIDLLKQKIIED